MLFHLLDVKGNCAIHLNWGLVIFLHAVDPGIPLVAPKMVVLSRHARRPHLAGAQQYFEPHCDIFRCHYSEQS